MELDRPWSLCYNFSCMFMSVLLQLANSALERKTRCDIVSMLVTNTKILSDRLRPKISGDKKGKILGLRMQSFQLII